jgi:Pentapeptide repeats (8 copies)
VRLAYSGVRSGPWRKRRPQSPFAAIAELSARTPVRVFSSSEIEKILELHRLYLETEYHEGHRANFSSADLSGRYFSRLNLPGIKMDRAVLRGANFTGARLQSANLIGAILEQARFDRADLSRARLSGANLVGASLENACLANADMELALMANTVLRGAKLREADMSGAQLDGTVRSRADLQEANLRGGISWCATRRGRPSGCEAGQCVPGRRLAAWG